MEKVTTDHGTRSALRRLVLFGIAVLVLTAIGYAAFYFVVLRPAVRLTHDVARQFREAFHFTPEIKIGDTTVIEQSTPVLELATVQRNVFQRYEWENSWAGSTKRIVVEATFDAKAGYDLKEPFVVTIDQNRLKIVVSEPKLLSFELKNYRVVRDENGWWNRITPQERTSVFKALRETAEQKATASGLLEDAGRNFEQHLKELTDDRGVHVELTYHAAPKASRD
jgi:Protein of unknown function (DUF4230)